MIVNKISVGYVIQQFDTATKECIFQRFIVGDEYELIDAETKEPILEGDIENDGDDLYFPYNMVQPWMTEFI